MKLSDYIKKSKEIIDTTLDKKIKVAILSDFTLNGLPESLRVKCAELNIHCTTYLAPYNQFRQEMLNDKSNLYKFNPDVCFLILDSRSVLADSFYSFHDHSEENIKQLKTNKVKELIDLINSYISIVDSKLVITNFAMPSFSSYGIFETKSTYGLREFFNELNHELSEYCKTNSSVYLYDFNSFISKYGENNIFDYRQYFFGDIRVSLDYIPKLADDIMSYIKPILGLNRKCIVLDLDNTLWGGVVGEDGFEGIKLGSNGLGKAFTEFQRILISLKNRGIILAINSKNNPNDAWKVIREHPDMLLQENDFSCVRINWEDKVSNMREIASELNIGLQSIVYFDDDPVNREFMRKALPEVLTIELPTDPSFYAATLMNINDFNVLQITDEDKNRSNMYLQQKQRQTLAQQITSLQEFLSQLQTEIVIKRANEFTIPRISQLTLKTNQFNLTTRRYHEEDIRKFSEQENMIVGCAQVKDKFGDNGITGAFIIKKNADEWIIDTFLLSCRIMGRDIEHAIMGYIIENAKKQNITKIKAEFIPTAKNMPAEKFLPDCGFRKETDNFWICDCNNFAKKYEHVSLRSDDDI